MSAQGPGTRDSILGRSINLANGKLHFQLKMKLIYDRQSVGQSVLVPGRHLEPMTRFLLSV
jgi:hypothetical protein